MLKIDFSKWMPDGDPKVGELVECSNLIPYDGKLMPFYGANAISSGAVSSTTPLVLFYVYDPSSANKSFIGTNDKIYRLDTQTLTDVSKAGGYTLTATTWDWCVYEDNVVMVAGGVAPQVLADVDGGAAFANLGGSPTNSKCCAMYKDHLFLGNQTSYPRRLQISASGDITDFVASTATGAGTLDMPSWGEEVIALMPIGDYLAVYMTNSIYLVDFLGPPLWFSTRRVATGIGLIGIHAVAEIDKNTHVFMGKKDIFLFTPGSAPQPIGVGVRRRVLENVYLDNAYLITNLVDRSKKVVMWLYPTATGDGTPDKILIFNYEEGRFSEASYDAYCIGNILSASMTINGMDDYFATIADVGVSFDNAYWLGGDDLNGIVTDADKKLSSLTSATPKTGTIETGEINMEGVRMIRQLRPIIEKPQGTVTATVQSRYDDSDEYTETSVAMNSGNALVDLRASGRYHKLELVITGTHSGLRGCNIDEVSAGER